MNNDLISRSALKKEMLFSLNQEIVKYKTMRRALGNVGRVAIECADKAPTVDAEPVRHGRWQFERRGKDGMTETPVCSGCCATPKYYVPKNNVGMQVPPYCHECGSKMAAEVKMEVEG